MCLEEPCVTAAYQYSRVVNIMSNKLNSLTYQLQLDVHKVGESVTLIRKCSTSGDHQSDNAVNR